MENTTEDKTEGQTRNKDQSLDEWLAEEQARLDKGFTFEPQPTSAPSQPGTAEQALAGLGLGAGVAGLAVGGFDRCVAPATQHQFRVLARRRRYLDQIS